MTHEQAQLDALSEYAAGTTRSHERLREQRQAADKEPLQKPQALCPLDGSLSLLDFQLEVREAAGTLWVRSGHRALTSRCSLVVNARGLQYEI